MNKTLTSKMQIAISENISWYEEEILNYVWNTTTKVSDAVFKVRHNTHKLCNRLYCMHSFHPKSIWLTRSYILIDFK